MPDGGATALGTGLLVPEAGAIAGGLGLSEGLAAAGMYGLSAPAALGLAVPAMALTPEFAGLMAAGLMLPETVAELAPMIDWGIAEGALELPFGLTTSDLLQGGLRLGGNLLQQNALNNAQSEVSGIKNYLDRANRGYTDDVMGVIDEMGARNTPEARADAYGLEAGKDTATLGEAMTSASQSMPKLTNTGNTSQRYMSGSARADAESRARIGKLAELMGNLNAHQGRAQNEALKTALDQSKLNTIGADRRSTNRAGSLALAGVQPSGGQMMFGDLLGFAADAMAAKAAKPSTKAKII